MSIHRATFVQINLDLFKNNLKAINALTDPDVKLLAVVKADAYGHGALPCAQAALEAGADWLGVGIIEEGIELRNEGVTAPLLILTGVLPDEIDDLIQQRLSTVVFTPAIVETLAQRARLRDTSVGVHVKVDTGMGRLGVLPKDFLPLLKSIQKHKSLRLEGITTHFSSADEPDPEYTQFQIKRFKMLLSESNLSVNPRPLVHCANSSAIIRFKDSVFDMVRPGLILYGALPSPHLKPFLAPGFNLSPVMQWKTRIIQINRLPEGSSISYGRRYMTSQESLIATLPLGYADGLSRKLSNRMKVLVGGQLVPQVGTICMDMCLVDISSVPTARVGDEVILLGKQGDQEILSENMAEWAETIPYEIFCGISKRVPRVYCD